MKNKNTGVFTINMGGKEYALKYDWQAISDVAEEFGDDAIQQLNNRPQPQVVAGMLIHGLKGDHGLDVQKIMDLSPPLITMINAIDHAMTLAYFGGEVLKEIDQDIKADEPAHKKKSKKKKQTT